MPVVARCETKVVTLAISFVTLGLGAVFVMSVFVPPVFQFPVFDAVVGVVGICLLGISAWLIW